MWATTVGGVRDELLYGRELWDYITAQAGRVIRGRAAVAHVGSDADTLLPFEAGDTVVIDGTKAALRSGAINPEPGLALLAPADPAPAASTGHDGVTTVAMNRCHPNEC